MESAETTRESSIIFSCCVLAPLPAAKPLKLSKRTKKAVTAKKLRFIIVVVLIWIKNNDKKGKCLFRCTSGKESFTERNDNQMIYQKNGLLS